VRLLGVLQEPPNKPQERLMILPLTVVPYSDSEGALKAYCWWKRRQAAATAKQIANKYSSVGVAAPRLDRQRRNHADWPRRTGPNLVGTLLNANIS
jgi:hypothetical protein